MNSDAILRTRMINIIELVRIKRLVTLNFTMTINIFTVSSNLFLKNILIPTLRKNQIITLRVPTTYII